jgi:hypothetical protein
MGAGINFDTNSMRKDSGEYSLFQDCVQNHDAISELRIDWYATSMHGVYAPPGNPGPLISAPRVPKGEPNKAAPIDSCISYGQIGNTTTAPLLGTPEDVAGDAEHRDCSAASNKPSLIDRAVKMLAPLFYKLVVAVPSDAKTPESSLVVVDAQVNLVPLDPKRYHAELSYYLNKSGKHADLGALALRPAFVGPAERLTHSVRDAFPGGILRLAPPLPSEAADWKDVVSFEVTGGENWELVPARFEFVDRDNRPLAAIDLPLLAPTP